MPLGFVASSLAEDPEVACLKHSATQQCHFAARSPTCPIQPTRLAGQHAGEQWAQRSHHKGSVAKSALEGRRGSSSRSEARHSRGGDVSLWKTTPTSRGAGDAAGRHLPSAGAGQFEQADRCLGSADGHCLPRLEMQPTATSFNAKCMGRQVAAGGVVVEQYRERGVGIARAWFRQRSLPRGLIALTAASLGGRWAVRSGRNFYFQVQDADTPPYPRFQCVPTCAASVPARHRSAPCRNPFRADRRIRATDGG